MGDRNGLVLSSLMATLVACSSAAPPQSTGGATQGTTGAQGTGTTTTGGTGSTTGTGSSTGTGTGGSSGSSTSGGSSSTGGTPTVSTLSGASNLAPGNPQAGFVDGTGGPNGTSRFNQPLGVAVDAEGAIYIADTVNHVVRKLDASGASMTLAGNGTPGFFDGTGGRNGTAEFGYPSGIAVDAAGNVYVSDDAINRVRKIAPDGTTTTLAGNGVAGFQDGTGGPNGTAQFKIPGANLEFSGLCFDPVGQRLILADTGNHAIRAIDLNGNVTTVAGDGSAHFIDGTGGRSGTARFNAPGGCAVDLAGNIIVADSANCSIRKIDLAGDVTTLSGNGGCASRDGTGGRPGTAQINFPQAVAVDAQGVVYATDTFDDLIRRIATDGTMTTVAGAIGYAANGGGVTGWKDGPALSAEFDAPAGIAIDPQGALLISEFFGNVIRKLTSP